MTQTEKLQKLNQYLLAQMPQYNEQAAEFERNEASQLRLFRSLVNIRMPKPASREFLDLQDEYLQTKIVEKGITGISDLAAVRDDIYLWRGDITTFSADAVVNAANSGMLGCFCPCHGCIDNAIHTFAGVQLRLACAELMKKQGHEEPIGQAKLTPAFNLPSKYVIHTVGPVVNGRPTGQDRALLASCYRSCLALADEKNCRSIAFCCISTGEFHFPNDIAAELAIRTVTEYKEQTHSKIKVVFNVFNETDERLYRKLLGADREAQNRNTDG